ncbi:hypothetical protein NSZ01_15230 [Nocardioides szechwanensis]|uniref:Uncharacterized protein n=1 Tax=Nocardioides szechwanensis TaxID=1005944 RepID=A0A1G9Z0F0_9ACTN|nr:hypothetical protein [Nocardioides szechwanensis]GEP33755.1 hypothetical protein NSZ01_15230 [Nocardioides szechwanensis]SDN14271.1 hypothetical protein SAMN05192576_1545 [Nocardioides szechwanensis]
MRSSRLIAILVALVFAALAPMSSAQATTTDSVYAKARVAHTIKHLQAAEIRQSGRFFVKGQVTTYPNKFVKLHKKKCDKCAWKPLKQTKTSGAGSFRMEFDGPRGSCYRLFVPGTAKYKPAYRPVGCIIAG